MHRAGADQSNMQTTDFLCDFCERGWDGQFPVVEGHQGSLICGDCLMRAYREVVIGAGSSADRGSMCRMCLEQRDEPAWGDASVGEALICERCIRLAAGTLDKDEDWTWTCPEGENSDRDVSAG